MADNPPEPKKNSLPPLRSSGSAGRPSSPMNHLPGKKGGAGKIVVMLSSVAKPPPSSTDAPRVAPLINTPQAPLRPPPLPAKQSAPPTTALPLPNKSNKSEVKLPPKTTSIPAPANKPPIESKMVVPPLPAKAEPKKAAQQIPPIKLNNLSEPPKKSADESLFSDPVEEEPEVLPEGWKSLEEGELEPLAGTLKSLNVFERTEPPVSKLESKSPVVPIEKDKLVSPAMPPATHSPVAKLVPPVPVLPPALPLKKTDAPTPVAQANRSLLPPPLPPPQPKEKAKENQPPVLQVAPPLMEKAPELLKEKLPPPILSPEPPKAEKPREVVQPRGIQIAPRIGQTQVPMALHPPQIISAKAAVAIIPSTIKVSDDGVKKAVPPIAASVISKVAAPKMVESKPALKPAVLPDRAIPLAKESIVPAVPLPGGSPPLTKTPDNKLPQTRAARAKKRRLRSIIAFYVLFAAALVGLYFSALNFTRETRVEGQIIPPPGMTLSKEVWLVSDFRELSSGIAEDLAQERTPLTQEIQERQDHVQRVQADIAAREERIRLISQQMQAAKDEIAGVVKQSRDATQKIWDQEGAQIDEEYASRLHQLQKAIADRAKSLNLKYEPDANFQSPEVWANAYRLALYQVPAGIDSVKEHQWLGDLMKQWRSFLKTLDDRKEQLREKAAEIKLAPAPKITDLNAKVDELQQRIDGTLAEEVPLKAELQQAQTDLAEAQAADASLDDKYYKQLYALPEESIYNKVRIPVKSNGRFTWVDDDVFAEGEKVHNYWIFARARRADGRQYWALHRFSIGKFQRFELIVEPTGFISTKAILRPDLSPDEQEQ